MPDLFGHMEMKEFKDRLNKGESLKCPCCGRHSQIYKRMLHHSVGRQLIHLYKNGCYNGSQKMALHSFAHASALILPGNSGAGDFSKAKYWDLIEPAPAYMVPEDKRATGYWRLSQCGVRFVLGEHTIPKIAIVFDDEVIRFEGENVNISQVLGEKFNYTQLMSATEGGSHAEA